jgi:hypothetical protein
MDRFRGKCLSGRVHCYYGESSLIFFLFIPSLMFDFVCSLLFV